VVRMEDKVEIAFEAPRNGAAKIFARQPRTSQRSRQECNLEQVSKTGPQIAKRSLLVPSLLDSIRGNTGRKVGSASTAAAAMSCFCSCLCGSCTAM
jgi:hypothetical protein